MDDRKNTDMVSGTLIRRTTEVRIGGRLVRAKTHEERADEEGVIATEEQDELFTLDCGHVGEVGGRCSACSRLICRECASRLGTCSVCGGVMCGECAETSVLDRDKRYHRACFWEGVLRKLFG